MLRQTSRVLAILVSVAGSAFAQPAALPFVGRWDCEVATFTFTDRTYDNGSETLDIRHIRREGANYRLTFADGYAISLRLTPTGRLNWYSFTTGDRFTCKKLR